MRDLAPKKISDSTIEHVYQIRPEHLNGAGRLFGGRLMEWIDEIAGLVGMRHAQTDITTASVDNLKFIHGAYQNDLIVLIARLTYVGNTSMEVRVDTFVEELDGTRKQVNRAYLVLVALDEHEKPVPVPGLLPETDEEKAEWEAGVRRHELRRQRRAENF